jgi:hypothetical protein
MDLFGNSIFYYEGCKIGKKQKTKNKSKQKKRWQDDDKTLPKEKDDSNFLSFCLLGVNDEKKLGYQKNGCHVTLSLVKMVLFSWPY